MRVRALATYFLREAGLAVGPWPLRLKALLPDIAEATLRA